MKYARLKSKLTRNLSIRLRDLSSVTEMRKMDQKMCMSDDAAGPPKNGLYSENRPKSPIIICSYRRGAHFEKAKSIWFTEAYTRIKRS